jgi:ATP-binding cassette subfamily B protein
MPRTFPHLPQPDAMDCGATCLAMVSKYYCMTYTIQKLREMCSATRSGVSLLGISDAAEKLGFKTLGARLSFEKLAKEVPLPCIVHWRQGLLLFKPFIENVTNKLIYNFLVGY